MTVASRLQPFGQTVFAEMSRRAAERGAINLGQGFPNFDGPEFVKEAAIAAIDSGHGQYAPTAGIPELAAAIGDRWTADTGLAVHAAGEVTVTSGCTEALAATFLGLVEPGDEVVLIEPYYDAYPALVAMAGAVPRHVTLQPPGFRLEETALRAAIGAGTKAIVVNTPHNPTGRVFDEAELAALAAVAREFDLLVVSDEVYEHMTYDRPHRSPATLPGMRDRTIVLSSLGKTFSLTGWKIGWAIAPPHLTAGIRAAHQFLTFATATPLQHGAAAALAAPGGYFEELRAGYRHKRDLLTSGLAEVGFDVFVPEGTYFVLADHSAFGFADDVAFANHMVDEVGVAVIPPGAFYHRPAEAARLTRFAFCKDEATLEEALQRMGERLG